MREYNLPTMASTFGSNVAAIAVVLAIVVAAILPTCLYLYVEPRGRLSWGTTLDAPRTRRAPALVRVTAWLSFAIGQLAVPLAVAVTSACAVLIYLQAKLGAGRPLSIALTAAIGGMALAQSLLAMRLLPLGVRLLVRDASLRQRVARLAKANGFASVFLLSASALFEWGMTEARWLVHPWLRVVLACAAVRPVMGYAAVCLLHALLLGQCARVLVTEPRK